MAKFYSKPFPVQKQPLKNLLKRPMFERALVIEYLSQSRNKTISGIRMKNSILDSHFRKMLLTWINLMEILYQIHNLHSGLFCPFLFHEF